MGELLAAVKSQADQFNTMSHSANSAFQACEACRRLALPGAFAGSISSTSCWGFVPSYRRFQLSLIFAEPDLWGGLYCHSFWDLLG